MTNDEYKKAFDGLLATYDSLCDSVGPIIRNLKKPLNAETRPKLVRELRSLDDKRLELLDQMDKLAKPK